MVDSGSLLYLLVGCFALGMLHGVVPDEHTWPITFAYSVGTTTGRGGLKSGAYFSLAFTLQRAIMSELVFFAFAFALFFADSEILNGPIYVVVGIAMAIAGYLILSDRIPHFHPFLRVSANDLAKHTAAGTTPPEDQLVPIHWCLIHGFISGFGVDTGVLSTYIYLTTLPVLASTGLWQIGWLPGALFGFGTFAILMTIGLFFGGALQIAKRAGTRRVQEFGRLVGARTLLYGGLVFIAIGPLYFLDLVQSIPLGSGTFIVLLVLIGITIPTMILTWREVRGLTDRRAAGPPAGSEELA